MPSAKKPDARPPQAARALKIALLGAHVEHGPRGALEELRHSTLLLRPLSVLCSSHLQVMPRPCGGIEQHRCSPKYDENIGPQTDSDCTRLTGAEHTVSTRTGGEYGAGFKACEAKITADRLRSLSPQIPRETLHPQIFTVTDFVKFYHHRL